MNTRQSKVKPIVVEVAIRNAIARRLRDHGVAEFDTIATEVTVDLFGTRVVPTPDGVPTGFIYQGTHLNWPQGVDTRAVTAEEAATYTRLFALKWDDGLLEGESVKAPVVTTDNNAAHLRNAYSVLWNRVKHGKAQVESPPAPEPVHAANCACALCYSEGVGAIKTVFEVKTSDEWVALTGIKVMDPDGWDRRNFEESWGERITREEFDKRVSTSTCMHPVPKPVRKKAARKKVQPVVPEVVASQFDQDMAELDTLIDSL